MPFGNSNINSNTNGLCSSNTNQDFVYLQFPDILIDPSINREIEESRAIPMIRATTLLLTTTPMHEIKTP